MFWTSLGRVRKIALALPAIFLLSFFVLNVVYAENGILTDKQNYYLDSDTSLNVLHPDFGDGQAWFYLDNVWIGNEQVHSGNTSDLIDFSIANITVSGNYYVLVTDNTADCSSLDLFQCSSEIGYIGSSLFHVFDTNSMGLISFGTANILMSFGSIVSSVLYSILGLAVLLIGAGWAWSRFKNHVVGRDSFGIETTWSERRRTKKMAKSWEDAVNNKENSL